MKVEGAADARWFVRPLSLSTFTFTSKSRVLGVGDVLSEEVVVADVLQDGPADAGVGPLAGRADDHALADVVGAGERRAAAADGADRLDRERPAVQLGRRGHVVTRAQRRELVDVQVA